MSEKEEIPVLVGENCLIVMPHIMKEKNLKKGDTILITIIERDMERIKGA